MNQHSYGDYILSQLDNLRDYLVCEKEHAVTTNAYQTSLWNASSNSENGYDVTIPHFRRPTTSELERSIEQFDKELTHLKTMDSLGSIEEELSKEKIAKALYDSVCKSLPKIKGRKGEEQQNYVMWLPLKKLLYETE